MRDPDRSFTLLSAAHLDDVELPVERDGATRRTFLKLAGFGVASATLAGCSRGPVRLVVPRLDAAEGVQAGRPFYVATTCAGCEAACGMLARCRDGRPIKVEGNPDHAVSRGGLCAVGQASLLGLYDGRRTDGALLRGASATWDDLDAEVANALASAAGGVRLLSRTITSPSTRAGIERFVAQHGGTHVEWDPRSAAALLDAHDAAFGVRAVPRIHFDRADVIAAFDADFLGTWLSPVEFAKSYATRRRPAVDAAGAADDAGREMSRHVHVESAMSITGCAADERLVAAPSDLRPALAALCAAIATHAGRDVDLAGEAADAPHAERLRSLAGELWAARGRALVVCGSDDAGTQALAVLANQLLGSYGATLDLTRPSYVRRGDDRALRELIDEMKSGAVKVLVVHDLDPVYELPAAAGFADALSNVALVVTTAAAPDETSALATAVAPTPHELESWNDAEAVAGHLSLSQPAVPPLRSARTLRASLARWIGDRREDHDLLRDHWKSVIAPRVTGAGASSFDAFFDRVLEAGYVEARPALATRPRWNDSGLRALLSAAPRIAAAPLELVISAKVGVPEARHAHNAWLHEMPDPITTIVWDNCAQIAPATAADLGVESGDIVRVATDDGTSLGLPAVLVPGQHARTIAIPAGYGVSGTDRFSKIGPSWLEGRVTVREGETVGGRAAALLQLGAGGLQRNGRAVEVSATGASADLATTQDHHRMEVPAHLRTVLDSTRHVALVTTLDALREYPAQALHRHDEVPAASLWHDDHENDGPRWGLAIDLSACNGCSACVVACQSENNVPCVGKDEVRRHREMTWMRIDRYFTGEGDDTQAVHQPMMCQHCENAPCETVCPVLATVHSSDGLNEQVYNRCVGTRYCANNCPYKTRRFNWFDYPRADDLQNLALNPDVTVRSRGVMEKCSMCVQRIQAAKAESARTGAPVADGDIQTACQQSCPTNAITFGDRHDTDSGVAKLIREPRAYSVLAELNIGPGVTYLADVRNRPQDDAGERHE